MKDNKYMKSLTVGQLIKELQKHTEETKVFATWEGVVAPIMLDNFGIDVETYQPFIKLIKKQEEP